MFLFYKPQYVKDKERELEEINDQYLARKYERRRQEEAERKERKRLEKEKKAKGIR